LRVQLIKCSRRRSLLIQKQWKDLQSSKRKLVQQELIWFTNKQSLQLKNQNFMIYKSLFCYIFTAAQCKLIFVLNQDALLKSQNVQRNTTHTITSSFVFVVAWRWIDWYFFSQLSFGNFTFDRSSRHPVPNIRLAFWMF